jgi:hypothetical protein
MHLVEVVDTLNSQVVASITADTSLPSISSLALTGTNGGAFGGVGPLVLNWGAQDSNPGAQLVYTLQYSADGGDTWEDLDMDLPAASYQIDSSYLPASSQAMIRVLASDGFNTSEPMNSPAFVVPYHPPAITLNTPGNGSLFTVDQQIVFDALLNDPQDGPLDGPAVQWSSSLDGVLGAGAVLDYQASALSEGLHTITVSATDREGLNASASVQIYVLRQPQPQLCIQLAGNQALLSWPSSVTNFVLLSASDVASGLWTPVSAPPVAADSTQTVTVDATNAAQFFQLRMQ